MHENSDDQFNDLKRKNVFKHASHSRPQQSSALSADLFESKTLKRARTEKDPPDGVARGVVERPSDSEAPTNVTDQITQADIKYVNILYNTKTAQNGLSEGL